MSSPISRRPSSPTCATASRSSSRSTASAAPGSRGHVDSLSPASGLEFALLPPDNATGNFTKIVQRVPVKIVLDDHSLTGLLRPGMSAEPTVDTKATVLAERDANRRMASNLALAAAERRLSRDELVRQGMHHQALPNDPFDFYRII